MQTKAKIIRQAFTQMSWPCWAEATFLFADSMEDGMNFTPGGSERPMDHVCLYSRTLQLGYVISQTSPGHLYCLG